MPVDLNTTHFLSEEVFYTFLQEEKINLLKTEIYDWRVFLSAEVWASLSKNVITPTGKYILENLIFAMDTQEISTDCFAAFSIFIEAAVKYQVTPFVKIFLALQDQEEDWNGIEILAKKDSQLILAVLEGFKQDKEEHESLFISLAAQLTSYLRLDALKILFEQNPFYKLVDYSNALLLALAYGYASVDKTEPERSKQIKQFSEILTYFLDNGIDMNGKDDLGNTVLHTLCHCQNEILKTVTLIYGKNGANFFIENNHGLTPHEILILNDADPDLPLLFSPAVINKSAAIAEKQRSRSFSLSLLDEIETKPRQRRHSIR